MKKIIILLLSGLFIIGKINAQFADFDINLLMKPATLALNNTGILEVSTCNNGSTSIVANSLRQTISVGTNAEIIGLAPGSDPRFTILSLTSGTNNTVILTNTGGTLTGTSGANPCATVLLSVKGTVVGGPSTITGTIGYIAGNNPLLNAPNLTQGNTSTANDNSTTSLIVTAAALPVNFKSITATRNKQNVAVKWQTAQEQNNKGFHVQRKTRGDWENIAFVFSAANGGNSSTDLSYSYNDVNTEKGISQYRVMQVDIDGKSKASEIRSVKGEEMANAKMIVYPNPSMDGKVNVVFEEGNGSRSVVVSDMSGRKVKQYRNVSSNTLVIEGLENGVYSIQVRDINTSAMQVEKIIVKKR